MTKEATTTPINKRLITTRKIAKGIRASIIENMTGKIMTINAADEPVLIQIHAPITNANNVLKPTITPAKGSR